MPTTLRDESEEKQDSRKAEERDTDFQLLHQQTVAPRSLNATVLLSVSADDPYWMHDF